MNIEQRIAFHSRHALTIAVKPKWKRFLGKDDTRLLLFSQIIYKWKANEYKSFYNFYGESNSPFYRDGQSWEEILEITNGQLLTAFYGSKKGTIREGGIATRIQSKEVEEMGVSSVRQAIKKILRESDKLEHLVLLTKDSENRTWHFLNERLFGKLLIELDQELSNTFKRFVENEDYMFTDFDAENTEPEQKESESLDDFLPKQLEKHIGKQSKIRNPVQESFYKSVYMEAKFTLSDSAFDKIASLGYTEYLESLNRFYHYYKVGNGTTKRSTDWESQFIDFWLPNAYEKGQIKKDGIKKGQPKSSADERIDIYASARSRYENLPD